MNKKIFEAIGEFIDKHYFYLSIYTIEGYFGFAYLIIPVPDENPIKWKFDIIKDEVVIEKVD
jgi:hypothetical protein